MPGAIGCNVVNPRITYNHHSTHMGVVYNVPKFCMSRWVQRLILGVSTDQIWHWPYRVPTKQWPKFLSWPGQEYRQSGVFKKWIKVVKNKHAQYYNILYTTTNSQVFLGIKWIWSCSFVLQRSKTNTPGTWVGVKVINLLLGLSSLRSSIDQRFFSSLKHPSHGAAWPAPCGSKLAATGQGSHGKES